MVNPNPFPNPFPLPTPLPPAIQKPPVPSGDACKRNSNACSLAQNDRLETVNNNVNNQNSNLQNLYNLFSAFVQAADLYLLRVINAKLGVQVAGGISGFLGRMLGRINKIADWLHLDRILNVLIWIQTLHNAYMLSANLGQTLFSAISNGLAAIGIKDAEGNPLNITEIFGGELDNFFKGVLGVTTWEGIKADWKKFNRIYQAAANLLWSIQSIGESILNAIEIVAGWTGKIGNALRKFGVVAEKAYEWFNPSPNFNNKFFTGLETATEVTSQIDTVASEVLSVQQTVTEIGKQKKELQDALGQNPGTTPGNPAPEAKQEKSAGDAAKAASTSPVIPVNAEKKPEA